MEQTNQLLSYLEQSTSAFHAVQQAKEILGAAGYIGLEEGEAWPENLTGKFWVTRNDSSLIAFDLRDSMASTGLRLIGAHTDSPCLKVKPLADEQKQGHWTLGIEPYGGVLLATWFDRDLSMSGRVSYIDPQGVLQDKLVDLKAPVAVIPSLAIHLRRGANDGWKIDPQKELNPMLSLPGETGDLRTFLKTHCLSEGDQVLDYDLTFYPSEPPRLIGAKNEMIASARLDNLLSCFGALKALCAAQGEVSSLVVLNDHEEVGSGTASGAAGNFLESVLERLFPEPGKRAQLLSKSYLLSADNAHAVHPNYPELHDPKHAPTLGKGPVIKSNASQSYITDSVSSARFQKICQDRSIPCQHFAIRADLRCGSTIGPLTVRRIGISGLDIGVPTLAMHSARELMAQEDLGYLIQVMTGWLEEP